MLEKEKDKYEKMEKENKKTKQNNCFLGGHKQKSFLSFLRNGIFRKIGTK